MQIRWLFALLILMNEFSLFAIILEPRAYRYARFSGGGRREDILFSKSKQIRKTREEKIQKTKEKKEHPRKTRD